MTNQITIADHVYGGDAQTFIIAEIGQAHEGSLGTAHAFIDAVAETGVDAVKFQTHIADAESTLDEPFRTEFACQDSSRFEYWKRMEFTPEQWRGLSDHAIGAGLVFLSSPFSYEAVLLLRELEVAAWKVASSEMFSDDFVLELAKDGVPLLISTGLATRSEIRHVATIIRDTPSAVALFQATTEYPTSPRSVGLNLVQEMSDELRCPIGLSDHSGTPFPSLAAVAMGASLVEVHVTLSERAFGPDVSSSLTMECLAQLVEGVRFLDEARLHPLEKDQQAEILAPTRAIFGRSMALRQALPKGALLQRRT